MKSKRNNKSFHLDLRLVNIKFNENESVKCVHNFPLEFMGGNSENTSGNLNVEEELYKNTENWDNDSTESDGFVESLRKEVALEYETENLQAPSKEMELFSSSDDDNIGYRIHMPETDLKMRRKSQSHHVTLLKYLHAPVPKPVKSTEFVTPFNLYDKNYQNYKEMNEEFERKNQTMKPKHKLSYEVGIGEVEEEVENFILVEETKDKDCCNGNAHLYKAGKLLLKMLRKEMKGFKEMIETRNCKEAENVLSSNHNINLTSAKRKSKLKPGMFKKYIKQARQFSGGSNISESSNSSTIKEVEDPNEYMILRCESSVTQLSDKKRDPLLLRTLEIFYNDKGRQTVNEI